MPLELTGRCVVGVKQTRRALADGRVDAVYLAQDADPALTDPLAAQAAELGVPVHRDLTMAQLGRACGIAVKAASAATLVLAE